MKIAMMTEGTYPHGFGGVSVWCDQLIRGMPGYDFHLVAIVATGAEQAVWPLPANVTSMVRVMLWGPAPARGAVRGGLPVRLLRGLVDTLLDPSPKAQPHFADVLRDLFEYAQHGDLSGDLISDKAIKVLSESWRDRWQGTAQSAPALHDAVTAMQLLAHCLRPLSYPTAQADVGHAVTNGLGVLPALAAKWQYGMPMLVTEHGVYLREQYLRNSKSPYRWPVKSFHLAFMRRLCMLGYSEAETITPGNVYNRRWEERLGAEPGRIRTVYNGVDPANFPAIVGEPAAPTISWVGRIDPIKDLETLLRAFCIVRRDMPGAKLRLFGAPPHGRDSYLQRCRALAAELGLEGAATFEGRIEDIRNAYGAGSIVALSSVSEGFPYSLIEAMTCGRTCVATDVGGARSRQRTPGPGRSPGQPGRQQQPLRLAGVVVEIERELRDARLGVAGRMLIDPGHRVAGLVGDEGRVRGAAAHCRAVAVRADIKGNRALEFRKGGESCAGQRPGGAVERTPGRFCHAERRRRVHVAVDLAHAEGRLVGVQRGQRPGSVIGGGIGDDDTVVVAGTAAGQGRQADCLGPRRAGGRHQGVGHCLAVECGPPGDARNCLQDYRAFRLPERRIQRER
jgi:glycosyltransferase involved in cell wall biosynthesis